MHPFLKYGAISNGHKNRQTDTQASGKGIKIKKINNGVRPIKVSWSGWQVTQFHCKIVLAISIICLLLPFLLAPSLSAKRMIAPTNVVEIKEKQLESPWCASGEEKVNSGAESSCCQAQFHATREHALMLIYSPATCGATHAAPSWLACNEFANTGIEMEERTHAEIHYYRSWTQEGGKPPQWGGMRCQRECELLLLFTFSSVGHEYVHTHTDKFPVWRLACCITRTLLSRI